MERPEHTHEERLTAARSVARKKLLPDWVKIHNYDGSFIFARKDNGYEWGGEGFEFTVIAHPDEVEAELMGEYAPKYSLEQIAMRRVRNDEETARARASAEKMDKARREHLYSICPHNFREAKLKTEYPKANVVFCSACGYDKPKCDHEYPPNPAGSNIQKCTKCSAVVIEDD